MATTTKARWKGLSRKTGYINPFDVWAKHPDRPAMIDTRSQLGGIGGKVGKWALFLPRKPNMDGPNAHTDREEKRFKTFVEATAWAAEHLGIKGWEYALVNRMGAWFSNDSMPDAAACETDVSRDYSYSICGKPATGLAPGGLFHDREQVPACNQHVAAERKRQERAAAWEAKREAWAEERRVEQETRTRTQQNERAAEDYAARLRGFGLKADVAYSKDHQCHGDVAVQGESGVALVEWIETMCREMGLDFEEEMRSIARH